MNYRVDKVLFECVFLMIHLAFPLICEQRFLKLFKEGELGGEETLKSTFLKHCWCIYLW